MSKTIYIAETYGRYPEDGVKIVGAFEEESDAEEAAKEAVQHGHHVNWNLIETALL